MEPEEETVVHVEDERVGPKPESSQFHHDDPGHAEEVGGHRKETEELLLWGVDEVQPFGDRLPESRLRRRQSLLQNRGEFLQQLRSDHGDLKKDLPDLPRLLCVFPNDLPSADDEYSSTIPVFLYRSEVSRDGKGQSIKSR